MPRILVVDDSRSTVEVVAAILSAAGHEVRTCLDGRRVLHMIESEPCDLVLTDIFMPDRDGLQIVRDVRRVQPNLPIVVMSGASGSLEMLRVAKLLGASQLLKKPFTADLLLAGIEAAFSRNS